MENEEFSVSDLLGKVDSLISQTNLNDVNADSNNQFDELPSGIYYCKCSSSKFGCVKKESSANYGQPMITLGFRVIKGFDTDLNELKGVNNRMIFVNYILSSSDKLISYVSDMMKFESPDGSGEPLLDSETWTNGETMIRALDLLHVEDAELRIWINRTKSKNSDGYWNNLTSLSKGEEKEYPIVEE